MTWLLSLTARLGIPEAYARLAIIITAITLLIGGLGVAKCRYDADLIARHDAARDVSLSEGARAADANAAETRRADDARLSSESIALDKVTANVSLAPVSDARRDFYACLRVQQAARTSGDPAPACR